MAEAGGATRQHAQPDEHGARAGHDLLLPNPRRQRQLARAILEHDHGHDPLPAGSDADPCPDAAATNADAINSSGTDPHAYPGAADDGAPDADPRAADARTVALTSVEPASA